MAQKILLKHIHAVKGDALHEFDATRVSSLTLGRDPSCEVHFDPDRDDLVSRRHAQITVEGSEAREYYIADLGSRNGTFVNRQRVSSKMRIKGGDLIQLGPGGPEVTFDLDPPEPKVRPTRMADEPMYMPSPPTREAVAAPSAAPSSSPAAQPPGPRPVSKATVEQMLAAQQTSSRKPFLWLAGLLGLIVIAGVSGAMWLRGRGPAMAIGDKTVTPAQIAERFADSVAYVELSWKLFDTGSGRQIFHQYVPNAKQNEAGETAPLVPGGPAQLPTFIALEGQLEPLLTTSDGGGTNHPIGDAGTGTAFVVAQDGFLMTNRHVAAAWNTTYTWRDPVGLVLVVDPYSKELKQTTAIAQDRFPVWTPAKAKYLTYENVNLASLTRLGESIANKTVEGRNDVLDITFPRERIRIPAKVSRVSDYIDVAMIKIDTPQPRPPVQMFDNYDKAKVGDNAIVLGYPGISPMSVSVSQQTDLGVRDTVVRVVPEPTLSVGNIGKIHRSQESVGKGVYAQIGDMYQLTINSTGSGNSGGPMFDDQGRVVGIFSAGAGGPLAGNITFAIPIRYGMELMGPAKVR
ncbi:MAG: FHA domain-containing protein [Bryobacteraceae bacterium]